MKRLNDKQRHILRFRNKAKRDFYFTKRSISSHSIGSPSNFSKAVRKKLLADKVFFSEGNFSASQKLRGLRIVLHRTIPL